MFKPILVQCPAPSEEAAEALSVELLERRLAASVHIRSVQSRYRWSGVVETAQEWVLDIKTANHLFDEVAGCLRSLPPYELPGIWAVEVCCVTPEYAEWLRTNTSRGTPL